MAITTSAVSHKRIQLIAVKANHRCHGTSTCSMSSNGATSAQGPWRHRRRRRHGRHQLTETVTCHQRGLTALALQLINDQGFDDEQRRLGVAGVVQIGWCDALRDFAPADGEQISLGAGMPDRSAVQLRRLRIGSAMPISETLTEKHEIDIRSAAMVPGA